MSPPKLKRAFDKSYVMPAVLYKGEVWCLKQNEMEILHRAEKYMVRAVSGAQFKDGNRAKDLMLMLECNDVSICYDRLHLYRHMMRMKDGLVLRRALEFEVEGQTKRGQKVYGGRRQRKSIRADLSTKDALCH